MDQFSLKGRVALVTGGNGGIGLGIAKGLAQAGADIAVVGRNADKNRAAVAELQAMGVKSCAIEADVADEAACRKAITDGAEQLGRLDILVNNAGISSSQRPEDTSVEFFRQVIETNLTSVFVACQAALPLMKAAGGGKIINLGSLYSNFAAAYTAPYGSSKGAVVQLTKSLAIAWARFNIQVNALLPGWIETDMTHDVRGNLAGFDAAVVARTPARRWGRPEDFHGPAVFLASAASDFVTGATLLVDGGYSVTG